MAATKKATLKAKTAKTTTQWRWSDEQVQFLLDNVSVPRKELVAGFRKEFKVSAKDLTDVAIGGRRYGLLNRPSTSNPERRVKALASKVADLEQQLAEAKDQLGAAQRAKAETSEREPAPSLEFQAMNRAEIQAFAEVQGIPVAKSWSKPRAIAAITAALNNPAETG